MSESLKKGLKQRHLIMMSIGGVIGAGFFLGAGAAIGIAGPAVIFSYLIGGLITFMVMALLTEMAVSMPVAGSFQTYASKGISPYAGFITGWTYWLAFLIGPASESIAAGTFLHIWFPTVPIWVFCLAVAIIMTIINVIGVTYFGEIEFWLSLIKVAALLIFIIWGASTLFGVSMNTDVTWANLTQYDGFAPAGLIGVLGAMVMVIFSYGGIEAIGTAAEESEHPEVDLPKALRNTIVRIVVLYFLSMLILLAVLPWTKAGISSSPYVDAFTILGGPVVGNVMNFVVLTAALSCIDTGVYATSRMLFSLSRDGYFPAFFSKVDEKRKTPIRAIITSSCVLFLGALLFFLYPDFAYVWLASLSGFGFLFAWLMIACSYGSMHHYFAENNLLKWHTPGGRTLQIVTIILILGIFISQFFIEGGWMLLAAGCTWLIFASLYYYFFARKNQRYNINK